MVYVTGMKFWFTFCPFLENVWCNTGYHQARQHSRRFPHSESKAVVIVMNTTSKRKIKQTIVQIDQFRQAIMSSISRTADRIEETANEFRFQRNKRMNFLTLLTQDFFPWFACLFSPSQFFSIEPQPVWPRNHRLSALSKQVWLCMLRWSGQTIWFWWLMPILQHLIHDTICIDSSRSNDADWSTCQPSRYVKTWNLWKGRSYNVSFTW